MKILVTLLLAFSFFGCGKKSDENLNEEIFTITHKATDNEEVIIYLQNKIKDEDSDIYELHPNECLRITVNQFNQLTVMLGEGGSIKRGGKGKLGAIVGIFKGLGLGVDKACPNEFPKCIPGNYEITNMGDLLDDYQMIMVNKPNTNNTCIDIEQWMDNKKN